MMVIIILSWLVITEAVDMPKCKGVKFNGKIHERQILKTDLDRPYLLTVDYSNNDIYFSYSLNTENDVFKTGRLNINSREFAEIQGVDNGFAQTIDQKTHTIYIGGSDGIYKYKRLFKKAELFGANGTNIWNIYFKNTLYFTSFPSQILYTFTNGVITRFKDLEDTKVDHFIIDSEDTIFFSNVTGLYGQEKGTKRAVLYQMFPYIGARALSTDVDGNAYAALQDGIYSVDKIDKYLDKVVEVEDAFGLAFDNSNNLIYSDANNIVRLKPNKYCTI